MKKFLGLISFLLLSIFSFAQETVEMADSMRADGKIYVVIAVLLIIFTGIVIYLVMLDRKISKIEKELKDKGQ